jgi:hypothetical protein
MLLVDLALNLEIQTEVRAGHRRRNVTTRVGAHHAQRAVPRSLRAMRWLQPQADMVVVHGLKRDIARPKAILATHKLARREAIEGSLPVVTHQQPFARETGREGDTAPEAQQAGGYQRRDHSAT